MSSRASYVERMGRGDAGTRDPRKQLTGARADRGLIGSTSLALGLAAGVLVGLALARAAGRSREMPRLEAFRRALVESRGVVPATMLAAQVRARHAELYARRPRLRQRALRSHLERNILPGLALYQVLREETRDREAALAEVDAVFARAFTFPGWQMRLLAWLPSPFALFRLAARLQMRLSFPPEGWRMEPVEDSERACAFDVRSCFYLETLKSYGAPELTALYCKCDDRAFVGLPTGIGWERQGTLARGRDRCDFRWTNLASEDGSERSSRA